MISHCSTQATGKWRKWGGGYKQNIKKSNGSCYKELGKKIIKTTSYFWFKYSLLLEFSWNLLLFLTGSSYIHTLTWGRKQTNLVSTPQSMALPYRRGPTNSARSLPMAAAPAHKAALGTGAEDSCHAALITNQPSSPMLPRSIKTLHTQQKSSLLCPNELSRIVTTTLFPIK